MSLVGQSTTARCRIPRLCLGLRFSTWAVGMCRGARGRSVGGALPCLSVQKRIARGFGGSEAIEAIPHRLLDAVAEKVARALALLTTIAVPPRALLGSAHDWRPLCNL